MTNPWNKGLVESEGNYTSVTQWANRRPPDGYATPYSGGLYCRVLL
jgi:hypothetical protein